MLAPAHSRRDDNQWADELTHPNPKGFDPALRVDLTPYFHKLALIPKILEAGDTALWQDNMDTHLWPFGEGWVLDPEHVGPSLRQPMALSWEGKTCFDLFPFDSVPF